MIRQMWRGCGYLPHVGEHPGTLILGGLVVIGTIAVGWIGAVGMLAMFGPLYLFGAYERANLSDRLEGGEK